MFEYTPQSLSFVLESLTGEEEEMAVPKTKVSKSRKRMRNAANFKVSAPALADCPSCHEKKLPHVVCKKCGVYKGQTVVEKKDKK